MFFVTCFTVWPGGFPPWEGLSCGQAVCSTLGFYLLLLARELRREVGRVMLAWRLPLRLFWSQVHTWQDLPLPYRHHTTCVLTCDLGTRGHLPPSSLPSAVGSRGSFEEAWCLGGSEVGLPYLHRTATLSSHRSTSSHLRGPKAACSSRASPLSTWQCQILGVAGGPGREG